MTGGDQVDPVGDHHLVDSGDRRVTGESAVGADEHRSAHRDGQPAIGMEGRGERECVTDRLADQRSGGR